MWWQVEEEPFLVKNDTDSMLNQPPPADKLKKYVVRPGHSTIIRRGRDNDSPLEGGKMYEGGQAGHATRTLWRRSLRPALGTQPVG